jgi:hypothetical protein
MAHLVTSLGEHWIRCWGVLSVLNGRYRTEYAGLSTGAGTSTAVTYSTIIYRTTVVLVLVLSFPCNVGKIRSVDV